MAVPLASVIGPGILELQARLTRWRERADPEMFDTS